MIQILLGNKKLIIATILVILLIIGIFFYNFGFTNEKNDSDDDYERYSFRTELDPTNTSENITVIVPFPMENNNTHEKILANLTTVNDVPNYEIVETEYGIGLEINISERTTLSSDVYIYDEKKTIDDFQLSLGSDENPTHVFSTRYPKYWIYLDHNCSVSIEYTMVSTRGSGSSWRYSMNSDLENGWRLVTAEIESED